MRYSFSVAVFLVAVAFVPAWSALAGSGGPVSAGPLAVATGGCQPHQGCSFDYVLDPKATDDPSVSWHAFWATTAPSASAAAGFCTIDVIGLLGWGRLAHSEPLPTRVFPRVGASAVGPGTAASLLVDAGGHAFSPGRLSEHIGWPAGLATTVVHHGWISVLWQGRSTRGVPLALAAEVANPGPTSQSSGAGVPQDYSIGVPCADVAPPGTGFLARLVPAAARRGQPSWLELRIPATGLVWKTPSEQTEIDGRATVAIANLASPTGSAKPLSRLFADRISVMFPNPYPGRYLVSVTLHGPTGSRRYRLTLTVR